MVKAANSNANIPVIAWIDEDDQTFRYKPIVPQSVIDMVLDLEHPNPFHHNHHFFTHHISIN